MKTPKRDVTAEDVLLGRKLYVLIDRNLHQLWHNGILFDSYNVLPAFRSFGASNSKGPFFQNPHNPKALSAQIIYMASLPRNEACAPTLLRAGFSALSVTVYQEKWVFEI